MKTIKSSCTNCIYYLGDEWLGVCRRHAPEAYPDHSTMRNSDVKTVFPRVDGSDWCGDHALNPEVMP